MKTTFICSSLEPGRDGVGDYTRRLAGELIRQGHEVRLISLNEKVEMRKQKAESRPLASEIISDLSVAAFESFQMSEGTEIECLRLPGTLSWGKRTELARQWVEEFNPDWISLQFVPFGFHPKGLCFGLGKHLARINQRGQARWHFMFHELWILWQFPLDLRKRLLGQLQKLLVLNLIRELKPQVQHTQLELYRKALAQHNLKIGLLPLHGSIKPSDQRELAREWLVKQLKLIHPEKHVYFGFFGNILPTMDVTLTEQVIRKHCAVNCIPIILSAGKIGGHSRQLFNSLQAKFKIISLGELSEEEATWYFQSLDFGLTSYPIELASKSSSVAAMQEHSLTVLACGQIHFKSQKDTSLSSASLTGSWSVAQTAAGFLSAIQQATRTPA